MKRIIINNKTDISDTEALWLVLSVVKKGRLSGEGEKYCLCSVSESAGITVLADRTKTGADTFTIIKKVIQ